MARNVWGIGQRIASARRVLTGLATPRPAADVLRTFDRVEVQDSTLRLYIGKRAALVRSLTDTQKLAFRQGVIMILDEAGPDVILGRQRQPR